MMTRSSMVCSLLLDFHYSFAMTPAFFWASLFHHESGLADESGYGGGVIGDDFGGIKVGKRKKKAVAANGNGVR